MATPIIGHRRTTRANMIEESLVEYNIPLTSVRDNDGNVINSTGGTGIFATTSYNAWVGSAYIVGVVADGTTRTSTLMFEFVLPPEYIAGADVQLVVNAHYIDEDGTVGTRTIDMLAYEMSTAAVASAIRTTSTQNFTATAADYTFSDITTTNLVPGDKILFAVRMILQDSGGSDGDQLTSRINSIRVLLDIKG